MKTPVKVSFQLSLRSAIDFCVICGKNAEIKTRYRLFDKCQLKTKTEICGMIECVLGVCIVREKFPNSVCRSCTEKVKTVVRKQGDLKSAFCETQEKLQGKFTRVKRMQKDGLTAQPRKKNLFQSTPSVGEEEIGVRPLSPAKKPPKEVDTNLHFCKPKISDKPSQLTKTGLISLLQYPTKSATLTMFHKGSPSKIPRPKATYKAKSVQTESESHLDTSQAWVSFSTIS